MKVCTDACIFGAFIARHIHRQKPDALNILDIGTGTGLLSLMVAQKNNSSIDVVEIDAAAFEQAKQNFEQSPWKDRLNIFKADASQFYFPKKYDFIISNPPFFEGDLKSGNKKKDAAKHDTTLTLEQLLSVTGKLLSPHGIFAVLLPYQRSLHFIEIAVAANYFLNEQLVIQHTNIHPFFRIILVFGRQKTIFASHELAIKNNDGTYTPEFIDLLKDYYLHL